MHETLQVCKTLLDAPRRPNDQLRESKSVPARLKDQPEQPGVSKSVSMSCRPEQEATSNPMENGDLVISGNSNGNAKASQNDSSDAGKDKDAISGLSVKLESPATDGASIAPMCTSLQGSSFTIQSSEQANPSGKLAF